MIVGRALLAWAARHALALALIVVILLLVRYAAPSAVAWGRSQAALARTVPAQLTAYQEAIRAFDAYAVRRRAELAAAPAPASLADDRLRARRAELEAGAAGLQRARLSGPGLALAAARVDSAAVFGHYRAEAELALAERERRAIDALLEVRTTQRGLLAQRRAALVRADAVRGRWLVARARAQELDGRFLAGARNSFCRASPLRLGCENYRARVAALEEMRRAADDYRRERGIVAAIDRTRRALADAGTAADDGAAALDRQRAALRGAIARAEDAARGNWLLWIRRPLLDVLPTALAILAAAILGPALLKAAAYFLLAPLAARRPPIRLLAADEGRVEKVAPAGVSQRVELGPGQELLILPEAVQSTPHHAAKRTQWLLDWTMPLGSLASGMVALIRIRVERADSVLVSATGGPLAEVALIEVGRGSALVLRPRALRGIVQPVGRPVRITRHWRLGHLSAWLTLRFRFLVLHGPAVLAVEGARGVRLEAAGPGRGVNRAATLGFSAGLPYRVSRSEAFGAYLLGRQELYNDSFGPGSGRYLYEEMPLGERGGGLWGRGLRGVGDAALKLFGL